MSLQLHNVSVSVVTSGKKGSVETSEGHPALHVSHWLQLLVHLCPVGLGQLRSDFFFFFFSCRRRCVTEGREWGRLFKSALWSLLPVLFWSKNGEVLQARRDEWHVNRIERIRKWVVLDESLPLFSFQSISDEFPAQPFSWFCSCVWVWESHWLCQ